MANHRMWCGHPVSGSVQGGIAAWTSRADVFSRAEQRHTFGECLERMSCVRIDVHAPVSFIENKRANTRKHTAAHEEDRAVMFIFLKNKLYDPEKVLCRQGA